MKTIVKTGSMLPLLLAVIATPAMAAEKNKIGKDKIEPGIRVEFVAETRDQVIPEAKNLSSNGTDIHLEAHANWAEVFPPKHQLRGEFVPYLTVTAKITDEQTGNAEDVEMLPHMSADDGLHYARNIKLPGADKDHYTIVFTISPPPEGIVNFHSDWVKKFGTNYFTKPAVFTYKGLDFSKVIHSKRD